MTIKRVREILGKRAERLTDQQIEMLITSLIILSNNVIEEVVSGNGSTKT